MDPPASFAARAVAAADRLSPAERRVATYLRDNREEALMASAAALGARAGTSDATVVRTARTLGYAGLDDLRRALAEELRRDLTLPERLAHTLGAVGDSPDAALDATLRVHDASLERLRRDVSGAPFAAAVEHVATARRVVAFGIGPSSAMASYLAMQLSRIGLDAVALTETGLLLADGLRRLRPGDHVVAFAYGRPYRELDVLLAHAARCGAPTVLLTDTLAETLRDRVDLVLPVPRGRSDMVSMHAATLVLIEALLVGVAARRRDAAIASLEELNALRAALTGRDMDLPGARPGATGVRREARPGPRPSGRGRNSASRP